MGPEKKSGGGAKPLLKLLPLALEAAERFRRKLQVDVLYLEVTAGAPDPADAAMIYGRTNAALGAAWQPLNTAFHIKDGRAVVRVAFDREQTTVYGTLAMSIKLGQALWLVLCLADGCCSACCGPEKKRRITARKGGLEPDGK